MLRRSLVGCAMAVLSVPALAIPIDSALTIAGEVAFLTDDSITVNTATVTESNPQQISLTDIGQGVGHMASMSGDGSTINTGNDELFIDYLFSLNNSSADIFELTFSVDFSNTVGATGADAFADSELVVSDAGLNELFFTDLISDSLNGDSVDGNDNLDSNNDVTYGETLSAARVDTFTLTLAGNSATTFSGLFAFNGGVYESGSTYSAQMDSFIYLSGVKNLSNPEPPLPVPEPGSLALMLAGLGILLRRSRV